MSAYNVYNYNNKIKNLRNLWMVEMCILIFLSYMEEESSFIGSWEQIRNNGGKL